MSANEPIQRSSRGPAADQQRPRRALLTATVLSHIAQFHQPAINLLRQAGYEVHVAARNNLVDKPGLSVTGIDCLFDVPFERNPLALRNVGAARQLRAILHDSDYDLIHCNTPVAGLLTRLLGQRSRRFGARMVYTAHGFHFFMGASLMNWILYYPLEWASARGTDVLITINGEDYRRATRFPAGVVAYVPGVGVDVNKFGNPSAELSQLRRELGLPGDAFVVLSIGELNDNKNHQTVIRAIAESEIPNIHYLICGNGPLQDRLIGLTESVGLERRVRFLGYRRDVPDLLALADVFCLPSFREGLPLSVMEAMAAGKPVVSSRIRGVVDLLDEGNGGILVSRPDSVRGFSVALTAMARDADLRAQMGRRNKLRIADFSVSAVTWHLRELYGLRAPCEVVAPDEEND